MGLFLYSMLTFQIENQYLTIKEIQIKAFTEEI